MKKTLGIALMWGLCAGLFADSGCGGVTDAEPVAGKASSTEACEWKVFRSCVDNYYPAGCDLVVPANDCRRLHEGSCGKYVPLPNHRWGCKCWFEIERRVCW